MRPATTPPMMGPVFEPSSSFVLFRVVELAVADVEEVVLERTLVRTAVSSSTSVTTTREVDAGVVEVVVGVGVEVVLVEVVEVDVVDEVVVEVVVVRASVEEEVVSVEDVVGAGGGVGTGGVSESVGRLGGTRQAGQRTIHNEGSPHSGCRACP